MFKWLKGILKKNKEEQRETIEKVRVYHIDNKEFIEILNLKGLLKQIEFDEFNVAITTQESG